MTKHDEWKSAAAILQAVLPNIASAERLREYRVWGVWEEAGALSGAEGATD
jgi:hypothetical protein